jgi:hypothetical protein
VDHLNQLFIDVFDELSWEQPNFRWFLLKLIITQ